tara:strand:- start:316 stop:534 length:219 start_codon:yes stop_codon:yes gene_type:complete
MPQPMNKTVAVRFSEKMFNEVTKLAEEQEVGISAFIRQTMRRQILDNFEQRHTTTDFTEFLQLYKTFKNTME